MCDKLCLFAVLTHKIKFNNLKMYSSPMRSSNSGSNSIVDRMVTGIFRDLSTNETLVSNFLNSKLAAKANSGIQVVDAYGLRFFDLLSPVFS